MAGLGPQWVLNLALGTELQKTFLSQLISFTKMWMKKCFLRAPPSSGCWKTGSAKTCSETAVEWVRGESFAVADHRFGEITLLLFFCQQKYLKDYHFTNAKTANFWDSLASVSFEWYFFFKKSFFLAFPKEEISLFWHDLCVILKLKTYSKFGFSIQLCIKHLTNIKQAWLVISASSE